MSYINGNSSQLIKTGAGIFNSLIVNKHVSGVVTLRDGLENNGATAVAAKATLTVGGAITPGVHAETILTSDGTNMSAGETVLIGTITYTCANAITGGAGEEYFFLKGATAADTLFNLFRAINATESNSTYYGVGTYPNASVTAYNCTATTISVIARATGTLFNTVATTETSAHLAFEDTTLGGGTGASVVGVNAEGFEVRGHEYIFVGKLSETNGLYPIVNEVLWGGSTATALANATLAINGTLTGLGINYSSNTKGHLLVSATNPTPATLIATSLITGTSGNDITVSDTLANGTWGVDVTALSGGLGSTTTILNEYELGTDSGELSFKKDIPFTNGLYITVSGTVDYTVLYDM